MIVALMTLMSFQTCVPADVKIPKGTPPMDYREYTKDELRFIFKAPMNNAGTFEPLVFIMRQNIVDHERGGK